MKKINALMVLVGILYSSLNAQANYIDWNSEDRLCCEFTDSGDFLRTVDDLQCGGDHFAWHHDYCAAFANSGQFVRLVNDSNCSHLPRQ